jgi:methionyl aminopeptidase
MVVLKSSRELELMKEACQISAEALMVAGEAVKPGVSTKEIDEIAYKFIKKHGATPNFLNYGGFPATACISINDEVIHGIPKADRIIREGDIVSIDLGAAKNGYNGDNAATFVAGTCSPEAKRLMDTTRESLYKGIEQAVPGNRIGDISNAVQTYCEERGFGVVRDYVGHGVGTKLHEEPSVPNFGHAGRGIRLLPGMTLAIEPMINLGTYKVKQLSDGWTVKTSDGKLSAHFEHTVAITSNGPVILTKV